MWPLKAFQGCFGPVLVVENITGSTLQFVEDSMKFGQRDALLPLLKSMKRGRWQTYLLGESLERHIPTLSAQKSG